MTSFDAANSPEVPEADRLEQDLAVDDEPTDEVQEVSSLEVNEADAAEQSRVVPDDEDYPRE
ncbi:MULTISPECIES: hypothetical protein [Rhodococcus]|uniref:Uncharacterized protein n=1 Tax=Rhodococcus oxybenzonivorans TaxID=1990687 RepID=A0AAE4V1I3_9NOCA|nr:MULTISPECIES: hypothetical protein [Rhodococcus]MDV7245726.1 hypothetical protein [Rhodococcus oxybenzonivorans]MDV7266968.1 hypothetical protein [Rhodococcus oxybenzonivorans]MDV7276919.1 hypothetical protein [Rhodococcus oxybenzonivorans]MDV7336749.1 hypothetical protein [Rhodococcus oxybenzonivorans]MDV7346627.1 hypothetical protein [Rhodococcus oxybenzonivorans]